MRQHLEYQTHSGEKLLLPIVTTGESDLSAAEVKEFVKINFVLHERRSRSYRGRAPI